MVLSFELRGYCFPLQNRTSLKLKHLGAMTGSDTGLGHIRLPQRWSRTWSMCITPTPNIVTDTNLLGLDSMATTQPLALFHPSLTRLPPSPAHSRDSHRHLEGTSAHNGRTGGDWLDWQDYQCCVLGMGDGVLIPRSRPLIDSAIIGIGKNIGSQNLFFFSFFWRGVCFCVCAWLSSLN